MISLENAVEVADNYEFEDKNTPAIVKKNARTSAKEIEKKETIFDENNDALFHIINYKGGGYVIVSADVRTIPVLPYSDKNAFDITEAQKVNGLKLWLKATKQKIKEIKKENKEPHDIIVDMWKKYLKDGLDLPNGKNKRTSNQNCQEWYTVGQYMCQNSSSTFGPLLDTQWGQEGVAQQLVPQAPCGPCNRAPAGCGPIAVGQVARGLFAGVPNVNPPYDYNAMPLFTGTQCGLNGHGQTQLAIMSSMVGVSMSAEYNFFLTCETLVVPWHIPQGLSMAGLNGGAAQQRTFGDASLMRSELSQGFPLIFYGYDAGEFFTSWHIWVCDGIRTNTYSSYNCDTHSCDEWEYVQLWMNWGWGGVWNNWYAFGSFNPGGSQYDSYLHYFYNIRR